MTEPITAAISAIGAVATLAGKLLKTHIDEQSKRDLVEMVSLLLQAQTNTMAVKIENTSLLDDKRKLTQEVERLQDWSLEKSRYVLVQILESAAADASESPWPKNVGLLFFNESPERFFPGVQIDVVWFPDGAGGDRFEEKIVKGPLVLMTREALIDPSGGRTFRQVALSAADTVTGGSANS